MNAYVLTKVRDLGDVCACVGGHLSTAHYVCIVLKSLISCLQFSDFYCICPYQSKGSW